MVLVRPCCRTLSFFKKERKQCRPQEHLPIYVCLSGEPVEYSGAITLCLLISTLALISPFGATRASAATIAQVTVNANQSLGTLTNISKGLNTAVWDGHLLDSATTDAVKDAGIHLLRYPGGSTSDVYHWQSNTTVPGMSFY